MFRPLVLLVALLAAPVAAQSIDSINGIAVPFADPENDIVVSSIGTQLTITGSGFGGLTGLSKPKVFTSSVALPKHRKLKVLSYTDTELVVSIKSGVPGDVDLTVQPKGKGLLPLVATGVVRLVTPVFEQPNPEVASPGTLVTLSSFLGPDTFGTKKGKVKVGGKKAPVESWAADQVVFEMPAKLADGIYAVEVTNKIGKATVEDGVVDAPYCLVMDGSGFDVGGPDRFSCKFGGKKYVVDTSGFFGFVNLLASFETDPVPHVLISAIVQSGPPQRSMNIQVPVDLTTATFPLVVHGSPDGLVSLTQVNDTFGFDTTDWTTDFDGEGSDDWLIVLQSYEPNAETEGTQLAGNFVAHLLLVSEEGTPAEYDVSLGDFRVTVDPAN
jgi:hypothetical protein